MLDLRAKSMQFHEISFCSISFYQNANKTFIVFFLLSHWKNLIRKCGGLTCTVSGYTFQLFASLILSFKSCNLCAESYRFIGLHSMKILWSVATISKPSWQIDLLKRCLTQCLLSPPPPEDEIHHCDEHRRSPGCSLFTVTASVLMFSCPEELNRWPCHWVIYLHTH